MYSFNQSQTNTPEDNSAILSRLAELENKVSVLETKEITRDISHEQQTALREIIGDGMLETLWNNLYYNSSFAAESVTNATSTEDVTAKEVDTTAGKKFSPALDSRFRLNFYIGSGQTNITAYILSPAINTGTFTTSVPIATNTNLSYVGIKIVLGVVYLVASLKGVEKLIKTDKTITDDTTHTLEILYRAGESADIYYDNEFLGSISSAMQTSNAIYVYYPYLTSVKSASGSVNLTIENYEFAQIKR